MKIIKKGLFFAVILIALLACFSCQTVLNIVKDVVAEVFEKAVFNVKVDMEGFIYVSLVDSSTDLIIPPNSRLYKKMSLFILDTKIKPTYEDDMLIYKLE